LKLAVDIAGWWDTDLSGTILTRDNTSTGSGSNRLLNWLAVANGESCFAHVCVNVGKNINTAIIIDISNALDLATTLHSHVFKTVYDQLECAVGKGSIGCLYILIVWHKLVQNGLVCEFVNLGGVGDLSLVHESRLISERVSNIEEVRNNTGVHHPCVDSS